MQEPVKPWKFWHPLPLWQVLVCFLVAQLVPTFLVVALREGLGWPIPQWVPSGIGGTLGVLGVLALARRHGAGRA
jgi:hypothetical protein